MGGFSSGRSSIGVGRTVDGSRGLYLRPLELHGALTSGRSTPWQWQCGEQITARITIQFADGRLTLLYSVLNPMGRSENLVQRVSLARTPCNYGGYRRWFICPMPKCARKVSALYWAEWCFACRHCCKLGYRSQRERHGDRALRRSRKIRLKLGGDVNMFLPFPDKPKGIHWRTYYRLKAKAVASHGHSLSELAKRLRPESRLISTKR
jgi:hypothetical protein